VSYSTPHGIYVIEGFWDAGLRQRRSVQPALQLLESASGIPYRFIKIDSKAAFIASLRRWLHKGDRFPILYLGFHGAPGRLHITEDESEIITLEELSKILLNHKPRKKRFIYFSSCSALEKRHLAKKIINETPGLAGIAGYEKDVDFLESTALEMILLETLAHRKHFDRRSLQAILTQVRKRSRSFAKRQRRVFWF
jgi:hypothetical protein